MVLPLLLLVTLAVVQVGLIVRDQLVLAQVARAGAREAAVTADAGRIREAVDRAAVSLDTSRIEVLVGRDGGRGQPVTVSVTYREMPSIPAVRWLFPDSVALRSATTMRQEFG